MDINVGDFLPIHYILVCMHCTKTYQWSLPIQSSVKNLCCCCCSFSPCSISLLSCADEYDVKREMFQNLNQSTSVPFPQLLSRGLQTEGFSKRTMRFLIKYLINI